MLGPLLKYKGANEDNPYTHLRDYHYVRNALIPKEVDEADFMLRMFPYSLIGYGKSWLFSLYVDLGLGTTTFLEEYSIKQYP